MLTKFHFMKHLCLSGLPGILTLNSLLCLVRGGKAVYLVHHQLRALNKRKIPMIPYLPKISEMVELDDQLDVNENSEVSMDAITDSYLKENEQEDSENDDEYTEPPRPPTATECNRMLSSIGNRLMASTGEIPDSVTDLRTRLAQLPQTQVLITKFFLSARC